MNTPQVDQIELSAERVALDIAAAQADYPLDFYQEEMLPYVKEYLALPNHAYDTVVDWMMPYAKKAAMHFGDSLLLLAHYYIMGPIIDIVQRFGGEVGDSYQLGLKAAAHPEKKIIVEAAVHFMTETVSILGGEEQRVYITNPKAGCTMEERAKGSMIEPLIDQLTERFGDNSILPVCYMNTSGTIKALCGKFGGAVCTSSNVKKVMAWAFRQGKKVLFVPDRLMGGNVARWFDLPAEKVAFLPGGEEARQFVLSEQPAEIRARFDSAELILYGSECGVHSHYTVDDVRRWQARGYHVVVHPECHPDTLAAADSHGSTAFIWPQVFEDRAGTKKYGVATEMHMVENVKRAAAQKGIAVVNLSQETVDSPVKAGCACMSRNDPPHFVGILDLLCKGANTENNRVLAGDIVDEFTGKRYRLPETERNALIRHAKAALSKMIEITEAV